MFCELKALFPGWEKNSREGKWWHPWAFDSHTEDYFKIVIAMQAFLLILFQKCTFHSLDFILMKYDPSVNLESDFDETFIMLC